ncbi:MAG: glycosyl transferase family 4 [Polyangiaceae bacterium]|nr:glycosyl transferase family 4 [Polyangiaceae bacterium]
MPAAPCGGAPAAEAVPRSAAVWYGAGAAMIVPALVAFVVGTTGTWAWRGYARRAMLDLPGARSSHTAPTPRGGGVGALGGLAAGVVTSILRGEAGSRALLLAAATALLPLAGVSLVDDARGTSVRARYAVHVAAAAGAVAWLGAVEPAWLPGGAVVAAMISAIGVTALVSFYNFMDGLDGLVAGSGVIQFGFVACWSGEPLWLVTAGGLLGFLVWNRPPASIFLGDVGSTAIGALAGLAILAEWRSLGIQHACVALPIVGDAMYTLARRAAARQNLLRAHHSHVYQRLLRSGLSHRAISGAYAALTLACGVAVSVAGTMGAVGASAVVLGALAAAELRILRRGVPFVRPAAASPEAAP